MVDFIFSQFEKIVELFETEEENKGRFELFNRIMYIAGNLIFVIACFILVWKGVFHLYNYLFPVTSFKTTDIVVRTSVNQLLKYPAAILLLVAGFLLIVRLIVAVKVYVKPFHIMSIIGIAILVKKLWEIAFSKDVASYNDFLKAFVSKIFD